MRLRRLEHILRRYTTGLISRNRLHPEIEPLPETLVLAQTAHKIMLIRAPHPRLYVELPQGWIVWASAECADNLLDLKWVHILEVAQLQFIALCGHG